MGVGPREKAQNPVALGLSDLVPRHRQDRKPPRRSQPLEPVEQHAAALRQRYSPERLVDPPGRDRSQKLSLAAIVLQTRIFIPQIDAAYFQGGQR